MRHTKLLFAVEPEVSDNNDDLAYQGKPERSGRHRTSSQAVFKVPSSHVGENAPGADSIGSSRTSNHDTNGTNDLSKCKCCTDVKS